MFKPIKASTFWLSITTAAHAKKRNIHWIPRVTRSIIVSDDYKNEYPMYEFLWLNIVLWITLEHKSKPTQAPFKEQILIKDEL